MPAITNTTIKEVTRYRKRYSEFRGVDFSTDATQVADFRSPYAENLISDLAGFPEKRPGWRVLHTFEGKINALHHAVLSDGISRVFVHAGTKLYLENGTEIASGLNDSQSTSFIRKGELYFLDGQQYSILKKTEEGFSFSAITAGECFVPTTTIGMKADGSGTSFEAFNLLSKWRKNSMIGDGKSTTFQLDTSNLDADPVTATVEGAEKTEGTDFTVDRAKGTITFTTAPPVYAGGSGIDNIIVTFAKTIEGATSKINKCRFSALFGYGSANRYFFSGNPDEKNVDWCSGLDDPTYFPDTGYTKIGADSSAVMGYLKQYENLVVIKEHNEQDAEIFLRSASVDSSGTVLFPIQQGVKGVGAVSMRAFATLRDDPMFLSKEGVFAIASASITQQRSVQPRSFYVNAKLTKEPDLQTAVAAVWNGWYLLCVNDRCYVADSRQKSEFNESYTYEWYYWTNIPARVFLTVDEVLYFGTADGKLCRFNNDVGTMACYNDNGNAIPAIWSTKSDDFGLFGKRKTMVKRGSVVMIKPYTRSSIEVYVTTDKLTDKLIRTGTMDIFTFADIDFARFTFNTSDLPQVIPFNKKVKKFITLQLIFRNVVKDEGFGIYGTEVTYVEGNYVK